MPHEVPAVRSGGFNDRTFQETDLATRK